MFGRKFGFNDFLLKYYLIKQFPRNIVLIAVKEKLLVFLMWAECHGKFQGSQQNFTGLKSLLLQGNCRINILPNPPILEHSLKQKLFQYYFTSSCNFDLLISL